MNEREELYSKINADIIAQKPRKAICYDFDKMLSPDDMQTFTIISSYEIARRNSGIHPTGLQKIIW